MPVIRPISDLRNKSNEISELCHKEKEPVFITRHGKGDLVVMSHSYFQMLQNTMELYKKLGEAEELERSGDKGITHKQMMDRLKEKH